MCPKCRSDNTRLVSIIMGTKTYECSDCEDTYEVEPNEDED